MWAIALCPKSYCDYKGSHNAFQDISLDLVQGWAILSLNLVLDM